MQLRFRCGHAFEINPDKVTTTPVCVQCGDRRIVHVASEPPRFVGHASGPHVRSAYLEAQAVKLASVPLTLKQEETR